MAGSNPYLKIPVVASAQQPFTIHFLPSERKFVVDPATLVPTATGQKGSILHIAESLGIALDHSCGGVCACSTCHIYVLEGQSSCNAASEDEEDMLDLAPGLNIHSRLACQCVPNGASTMVVEIPQWNRNLVKEGH